MHPRTLDFYEAVEKTKWRHWRHHVENARHFHVSLGIWKAAVAVASHEISVTQKRSFPSSAKLPAEKVVVTFDDSVVNLSGCSVALAMSGGEVACTQLLPWGEVHQFGFFAPGGDEWRYMPHARLAIGSDEETRLAFFDTITVLAFVLSLINEPRRVDISAAAGLDWSRQLRKKVARITGKAALAYSVVSWQVGAGVKAKGNVGGDSDLKVALHWCRAHWRKADPAWDSAEWVSPTQGAPRGWYIWVKDCWKGHPDHGIKLQDHKPRMKGEKRTGSQAPAAVPNATKLAAMSAQQRAMLVQAGYAPSGSLH